MPSPARIFTAGTAEVAGAWAPKEEFTYKGADGKFDKGEATRLRITDEMALQLGDLAERHTAEERAKLDADVIGIREQGGALNAQLAGVKHQMLSTLLCCTLTSW